MGTTKTSKSCCSFLDIIILCTCSLVLTIAKSEVIEVGGSENRWSDGFNYVNWSQQFTFRVGDVLVFSYTKGKHNVYDVTKAAFQSCSNSTGVNAIYDSGDDHVELKEAKQYWFICTVDAHCQNGMKFGIIVSGAAANTTQTGNSSSVQTSSNNNSASRKLISAWMVLLAAGILSILVIVG